MTFFYQPNLTLGNAWRNTIQALFVQLRRIKFAVEETFSFGDFDPQVNWQAMTVTGPVVNRARYFKIFNLAFISLNISSTITVAGAVNFIQITVPFTFKTTNPDDPTNSLQIGYGAILNTAGSAVYSPARSGRNVITFYKMDQTAFAAATFNLIFGGFFEVENNG